MIIVKNYPKFHENGYTHLYHLLLSEVFSNPETFLSFDISFQLVSFPVNSAIAPMVDFVGTTDSSIYLDLQNTELKEETSLETEVPDEAPVPFSGDRVASTTYIICSLPSGTF